MAEEVVSSARGERGLLGRLVPEPMVEEMARAMVRWEAGREVSLLSSTVAAYPSGEVQVRWLFFSRRIL